MLLARPLKRTTNTISLFFIAGLVILAIDPGNLFDVGFQLSFLAVWAIIYVSPIIGAGSVLQWAGLAVRDPSAPRKRRHLVLRKFAGALAATAIATIAVTLVTAPAVAYYFNYFSLVSVPANMAVELGVPIVFADGFLSPVAVHIGLLGDAVGSIGTWTTRAMLAVVNELGGLRWSAVSVASPGPLAILGYYVILHAALGYVRSRDAA
jgi:competence protein ComEC